MWDSRKIEFSKEKMLGVRSKCQSVIGLDSPIFSSKWGWSDGPRGWGLISRFFLKKKQLNKN